MFDHRSCGHHHRVCGRGHRSVCARDLWAQGLEGFIFYRSDYKSALHGNFGPVLRYVSQIPEKAGQNRPQGQNILQILPHIHYPHLHQLPSPNYLPRGPHSRLFFRTLITCPLNFRQAGQCINTGYFHNCHYRLAIPSRVQEITHSSH